MATDARQISATLVELADTLVSDYDLFDYLHLLLERSAAVLGAEAGGVMLSSTVQGVVKLDLLACSDEHARVLELFELQRQEGPCVDSHRLGVPVVEPDLRVTKRWPQFTPVALERGYRAVYAFPLRLRQSVIGALNLFREHAGPVADADVGLAQAFADMATIGVLQERGLREARDLAGQLQTALNSRVIIEQAKGVVAERVGCGMDEAFQALRWYARDHNLGLRGLAASMVAGDSTADDFMRASRRQP